MSPHNVSFNGNQKSCDRMAWKVWNTEDPLPRLVCCYRLSLTLNVGEWGDKSHVCICYIPFVNTYVHKTDTWIFKTYLMLYFVDLTGSANKIQVPVVNTCISYTARVSPLHYSLVMCILLFQLFKNCLRLRDYYFVKIHVLDIVLFLILCVC